MKTLGSSPVSCLQAIACLHRFRALGPTFFSEATASGLREPELVCCSDEAARLAGLDPKLLHTDAALQAFSGNRLPEGFRPLAQDYAGHQFGHFNPLLGDGRALLLTELAGPDGVMELYLKGAGRTPYSRHADGRSVLRACLREFLASEAMAALGVPTTRSLCVTTGKTLVSRQGLEQAGMLVRIAPSHIRFGSFENLFYQSDYSSLQRLADFVIKHHYPHRREDRSPYAGLFQDIVASTARLIARWQALGFTHGVMNTDNLSVLGLTFDYGPFAFMESYHPAFVSNLSDDTGLYAFEQQPAVGLWSCNVLARALSPLITEDDLRAALEHYEHLFLQDYQDIMLNKLGLRQRRPGDVELLNRLLAVMKDEGSDYSLTLRALSEPQQSLFPSVKGQQWLQEYRQRRAVEAATEADIGKLMDKLNPLYIPRNHLLQGAIDKALQQDYTEVERLLRLFRQPFTAQGVSERYARPDSEHTPASAVSCSS